MRLHTDSERIDIDFKGTEEMQRRGIRAAAGTAMRMTIEEPIVYVVDDDASVRVALDSLVRSVGFRVQTFATAQDFLQHKPVNAPGCLVLDVQLPGLNGLDLQRELLHADIHIPIIFVTGHADIPVSVRAMKAGATEFLTKPFDDQDLLNAIQKAVERDRAAQQGRKDQESELEAAARIQQGLMAVTTPQPSFAIVSSKNQPCAAIGGDFFSMLAIEDGLFVAIADVSGKGIAAAVMASLLQGMIHEGLLSRVPLPQIARSANEFFCVRDLGAKYATFVIACVRPNGELEYVNCGHVPPLIASPTGVVTRLRESNVPVGLLPAIEYRSATSQLIPGDRIIWVTDGVTEAESPAGDFFGDERLETFAALGMSPDQIFESVRVFCAGRPLNDDCTVVGLHYTGSGTRS